MGRRSKVTSSRCKCSYCTDKVAVYRKAKRNTFMVNGSVRAVKKYIKMSMSLFNETKNINDVV